MLALVVGHLTVELWPTTVSGKLIVASCPALGSAPRSSRIEASPAAGRHLRVAPRDVIGWYCPRMRESAAFFGLETDGHSTCHSVIVSSRIVGQRIMIVRTVTLESLVVLS